MDVERASLKQREGESSELLREAAALLLEIKHIRWMLLSVCFRVCMQREQEYAIHISDVSVLNGR